MTAILRVATYNIHKGVSHSPSLRRRATVHEMRQRLHELQADVVFLQEVQGKNSRMAERLQHWPADPQAQYLALDPASGRPALGWNRQKASVSGRGSLRYAK